MRLIKLGSSVSITKDGKLVRKTKYRSASDAIAAKKRPKRTWRAAR